MRTLPVALTGAAAGASLDVAGYSVAICIGAMIAVQLAVIAIITAKFPRRGYEHSEAQAAQPAGSSAIR
ncbi:MAG: hypothetical protein FJW39_04280 [Acidobacteria bacterium]|nr:hypothetical protein [Acidobacteriota bacterium]